VQKAVGETVEWLKEWGCSRSMGLGTKLPLLVSYGFEMQWQGSYKKSSNYESI